jgi:hypothetical protein
MLSNMTDVAPLQSGPYTMYEWPVIQPQSAAQQYTSSSWEAVRGRCGCYEAPHTCRSKVYLVVMAAFRRYLPKESQLLGDCYYSEQDYKGRTEPL